MRKVLMFIVMFMILDNFNPSFAREVPFTQEDRDRLIRVEENQKELEKRLIRLEERVSGLEKRFDDMQKRFDDMQKRIDDVKSSFEKRIDDVKNSLQQQINDIKTFMLWGFGILFSGMGILIGFVIWDRRTALQPAINRTRELEDKEERMERALKELARRDAKVAEALKSAGLL